MSYRDDLFRARSEARQEFLSRRPCHVQIITEIEDLVPHAVLSVEANFRINKYTQSLLASFARSTIVISDLIQNSELIEAVALNRKQLELLARLRELDDQPQSALSGKTPNLKHIRSQIRKVYSTYSESAHSATYGSHSLLGFDKHRPRSRHILLPEFTENTEILFQHWVMIFFEFTLWVMDFKAKHLVGYDRMAEEKIYAPVSLLYHQFKTEAHLS